MRRTAPLAVSSTARPDALARRTGFETLIGSRSRDDLAPDDNAFAGSAGATRMDAPRLRRRAGPRRSLGRSARMGGSLPVVHLARHGETAWSLSGQHTGRTDLPLTERGERNAQRLGERLRGMRFAAILTSPLQ